MESQLEPGRSDGSQQGRPRLPPAGFGVARYASCGTARFELLYEHEYVPQPCRSYSASVPVDKLLPPPLRMRPALRQGKLPFTCFGLRVDHSSNHARCWLGQVLLKEVAEGRLRDVELLVADAPGEEGVADADADLQASWCWQVRPTTSAAVNGSAGATSAADAVQVMLRLAVREGISVEIRGADEACAEVYRILLQYCDDYQECEGRTWRPIPQAPSKISTVQDRSMSGDARLMCRRQERLPENGSRMLARTMAEWQQAESQLLQALAGAQQALAHDAEAEESLRCCAAIRDAFAEAKRVALRQPPEWRQTAGEALSELLCRSREGGGPTAEEASRVEDELFELGVLLDQEEV